MFVSRFSFVAAAFSAAFAAFIWAKSVPAAASATAEQDSSQPAPVSGSDIVQPSEARPPRAPLRLSTIDYQEAAGGKRGKLTVAGVALPGRDLYLFLDDKPLSQTMPDDAGNWSVESEMELEVGRHTFRVDQYDATTQMLAARAMITFERAKQPPQGDNAGSGEPPTAKATTP
jgi:hypothetical protein